MFERMNGVHVFGISMYEMLCRVHILAAFSSSFFSAGFFHW
jgi:hypothetical protein